jgi:hypothetical protein
MRRLLLLGTVVVWGAACAKPDTRPAAEALPFIENDYARALGEARAHQRPIFVETWAPW